MCYYQRIVHTCGHAFHILLFDRPCAHVGTPDCRPRHLLDRSRNARKCSACITPEDIAESRRRAHRPSARVRRAMMKRAAPSQL
ncbi:hypothetical protein QBC41DRAFT_303450 [Cercophora samala]|uniref:Uncharacterized protein n=1 Tax=Cercophora samala TaxID=330535 RepID=A0AA40DBZ1_9PEZI|nr:hypothetical protein QBC41DRAFT_303450 [Cercophora samala]